MNWKLCQLPQGERRRLVDLSAHGQSPISGVELDGFVHVIANKKVRHRRQPAVEIFNRRFKIEESQGAYDHPVFAGEFEGTRLRATLRPRRTSRQSERSQRSSRQALQESSS